MEYPSMAHMAGQDQRPKMATLISPLFCFPNLGRRIRGSLSWLGINRCSSCPVPPAKCCKSRPLQQNELTILPCHPASWCAHPCPLSGLAETSNHVQHVATGAQQSPANSVKWGWRDSTETQKGWTNEAWMRAGKAQGPSTDDAPGAVFGA